jgi:uncharacterized RDD family membrane protein YckC
MTTAGVHVVPAAARPFQGRTAGIVSRVTANMIDVSVGAAALAGLYAGWAGLLFLRRGRDFTFPTVSWSTAILIFGLVMVLLFATSWRGNGRTPGDRVLGLRVVTTRGGRLGWVRAVVRAVLAVLFPLLLLWAAISREQRSVHDLVMGTKVIYDWQTSPLPRASDDPVGARVDVAAAVTDEPDEGHPEPLGGLDGER